MISFAGRPRRKRRLLAGRFLAAGLAALLALAGWPEALAQGAAAPASGQRAGQVTAAIPAGWVERPGVKDAAAPGLPVLWDDLLSTEARGRARITLDDGSILNVGSNSSLRVVQHDATSQQTELILTFGQMRVRANKLTQPGAKFTVRTNTAVLGVIGTDFWVLALGDRTIVIVFEGAVTISNIIAALGTVQVGQGQQVVVVVNQPPGQPFSPNAQDFQDAINDTEVGEPLPQPPGPRAPGVGPKVAWIVGVAGVVAIVLAAIVVNREKKEPQPRSLPPSSGRRD